MAIFFGTCKLKTITVLRYFASCSAFHSSSSCSAFHSSSSKPPSLSSLSFLTLQDRHFPRQNICSHYHKGVLSTVFGEGLSCRRTLFICASLPEREKMEQQFEEFRQQLEESGSVRERLRGIVADLESVSRLMQANLLQVHYAASSQEVLEKSKVHIEKLKELYAQLAKVIKGCPGQYYRYHDHWRNQTYSVVFLIVFLHWLETSNLLSYVETQNLLGLNSEEFGIDIEDYLIGLCNMSNELPRYVVNQVTMGDYECPGRVSRFLSELYAAFRILNLRNDLLRKRFDDCSWTACVMDLWTASQWIAAHRNKLLDHEEG